jgi:hypothetical protein
MSCNELVGSGEIDLGEDGHYRLYWQYVNSCTGTGLGAPTDSGSFAQLGDSISFAVPGNHDMVWARVSAARVTVHYSSTTLDFQR